jgi:hypothetical protein
MVYSHSSLADNMKNQRERKHLSKSGRLFSEASQVFLSGLTGSHLWLGFLLVATIMTCFHSASLHKVAVVVHSAACTQQRGRTVDLEYFHLTRKLPCG